MIRPYIQISMRTSADTASWNFGCRFIELLNSFDQRLAPEFVAHDGLKYERFGRQTIKSFWTRTGALPFAGAMKFPNLDFIWKQTQGVKSSGYVYHTMINRFGETLPAEISLKADWHAEIDWCGLFHAMCQMSDPQLGMLHLFTSPELQPQDQDGDFQIGSFGLTLEPEIPDIGWAMFYGKEMGREVNSGSIMKAGFPVEKIGEGYLVRVTEDLCDIPNDFATFSHNRDNLRSQFRQGLFSRRGACASVWV